MIPIIASPQYLKRVFEENRKEIGENIFIYIYISGGLKL